MPLNIRDEAVNQLAQQLAKRTCQTKTDAVRQALEHEIARVDKEKRPSLFERIKPIQDEVASWPSTGLVADKAFYDSLYDDINEG